MTIQKTLTEEIYNVFESKKPENTSLIDLWIELDWSTEINIKSEKESFLTSILKEVVPLLIFFVLILFLFRFSLPNDDDYL